MKVPEGFASTRSWRRSGERPLREYRVKEIHEAGLFDLEIEILPAGELPQESTEPEKSGPVAMSASPSLFRNSNLVLLWIGQLASQAGTRMFKSPLAWWMVSTYRKTRSYRWMPARRRHRFPA